MRALTLLAVLAMAWNQDGVRAQAASGEGAAKARFTIAFARFVQWPAGAWSADSAPLKLCVLHNSAAVGAAFVLLEGQNVAGHPVNVLQNPRDRNGCEMLFVDGSAAHASGDAIASAASASVPVFTVGAVDGFLSQGGMVELVNVNDSLRFDVNLKTVRSARLALSGQVLRLARQVRD